MSAPRWSKALLRFLAPRHRESDILGDLEEDHRNRTRRRGRLVASLLTGIETLDVALALLRGRLQRGGTRGESGTAELAPHRGDRMSFSWLDLRLGLRMLVRYPGLTLVGGLAMAFAIWVGAGVFEFMTQVVYPTLPLDDGDRIVAIRGWNTRGNTADPLSVYDFVEWKDDVSAVEDLGGFQRLLRNLVAGDGRGEPVLGSEISASAFRVARVPPLMGRTLIDADEELQAPSVVVIGHGVWQTRFGGAADVLGRTVRLGAAEHTIVGVMPEGFAFPVADEIWIPLRLSVLDYERGNAPDFRARYQSAVRDLEERLLADEQVAGVTLGQRMPRMYHPWRQIEVAEGAGPPPDERGHRMGSATIDPDYFEVLGKEVLSGRGFHAGDVESESPVVIVNQSFVDNVLAGRNPIGRHIRYVATEEYRDPDQDPGPWHQIVGVVGDLGTHSGYGASGIYHPMAAELEYPVYLAAHVRGDPVTFAPRLRAIGLDVDPTLRLHDVVPLTEINRGEIMFYEFWSVLTTAISGIALLLSLAGIYSVMSFAVSRRQREIGIRVALGSGRGRIAASILRRPVAEVALGVLGGSGLLAAAAIFGSGSVTISTRGTAAVVAYALLMMSVCMLACIVPTRRALGVEPTEALRADG